MLEPENFAVVPLLTVKVEPALTVTEILRKDVTPPSTIDGVESVIFLFKTMVRIMYSPFTTTVLELMDARFVIAL